MNFIQCEEYVANLLDDINFGYFSRDTIKQWLNFAQREVQRVLLQANQNYYVICVQTTLVVGQPDYGLPSGFLKSHECKVITGGTYPEESFVTLTPITIQQAGEFPPQNGTPAGYFLNKNKMFLAPVPALALTMKLRYSYLVADMINANDVPDVPEQYHELVPLLALKYGFLKDRREEKDVDEKISRLTLSIKQDATNRQQDAPRRVRRTGLGGGRW